jgi:hypothetical protein
VGRDSKQQDNPVTHGKRIPTAAQFRNSNDGKDEASGVGKATKKIFGGLIHQKREAKKSLARSALLFDKVESVFSHTIRFSFVDRFSISLCPSRTWIVAFWSL